MASWKSWIAPLALTVVVSGAIATGARAAYVAGETAEASRWLDAVRTAEQRADSLRAAQAEAEALLERRLAQAELQASERARDYAMARAELVAALNQSPIIRVDTVPGAPILLPDTTDLTATERACVRAINRCDAQRAADSALVVQLTAQRDNAREQGSTLQTRLVACETRSTALQRAPRMATWKVVGLSFLSGTATGVLVSRPK